MFANVVYRRVLPLAVVACFAAAAPAGLDNSQAVAHDSNGTDLYTFGAPQMAVVDTGASYAGLSCTVVGLDTTGGNFLGTTATIMAGVNNGPATTVSMAWRNRTIVESLTVPVWPDTYRPPLAPDSYNDVSDVLELSGITGPYVLQMNYDESQLLYDFPETQMEMTFYLVDDWYGKGRIYLGWFNPHGPGTNDDQWEYAVYGNSTTGGKAVANYLGSFEDFLVAHPDFNLTDYMSSYGVDLEENRVWAVLDHNSQFVAIPEPATVSLIVLGGLASLLRREAR